MRGIQKKYLIVGIFIAVGFIGGFLYWRFVGCNSGSCPITSTWYISSIVGALIGFLTGESINDYMKKHEQSQDNTATDNSD